MSYDQILFMGCDGFIENSRIIIFIWRCEMILNRGVKGLFSRFFTVKRAAFHFKEP